MSKAASNSPRRGWRTGGCLALVLLPLLLLLLLGGAAWFFWPLTASPDAGLLVYLTSPQSGALVELNAPVGVQGIAHGALGVTRLELYADGALVAVQNTTLPGGSNPLVFDQQWTPLTTGRHVLMTRAYGTHGGFSDSDVRFVDVLAQLQPSYALAVDGLERGPGAPAPSLIDVARGVGLPAEQLLAANPHLADGAGPSGFDSAAPLPTGTVLDIPRTPAPPPGAPGAAPTPSAPPAPLPDAPPIPAGLVANADCTSVALSWHASAGATAYAIYRLGPDAPVLARLATLPADRLSYRDPLPAFGNWRYQLAAVRDGLEGLSPLQTVDTPALCVPPATLPDTRVLTLLSLRTIGRFDGVYCYLSFNGAPYEREPAGDFDTFLPGPDGQTYNLARDLSGHGQFLLGVPPDGRALTVSGECFGRRGLGTVSLGVFSASHLPADWDGRELHQSVGAGGSGFMLGYRLDPNTAEARSSALGLQLGFSIPPVLTLELPTFLYGPRPPDNAPTPQGPPVPGYFDNLPWPTNVHTQRSLDGCQTLPDTRSQGRCVLGGLLGGGWPTLYWDWAPNSHYAEADLVGYLVRATFHPADGSPDVYPWRVIVYRPAGSGPIPRSAIIPTNITQNLPCGLSYRIVVRAIIAGGLTSGPGIIWDLPTRPCPVQARLRVVFETLTLASAPGFPEMRDVNGDPCFLCVDRRLELKDRSGPYSMGPAFWANGVAIFILGWGGNVFAPCPDHSVCLTPGEHQLADVPLAAATTAIGRELDRQGTHNNWVELPIDDLQSLSVGFGLNELDQAGSTSTTGTGCDGHLELAARTVEAWTRVRESHTLTGPGDEEGTCQVNVSITGTAFPVP